MRKRKIIKPILCFLFALNLSITPVFASIQGNSLGTLEENDGHYSYQYENADILENKTKATVKKAMNLPESYSLVDEQRSTNVKNQGGYGTCWTFGALASLESNMITQGLADTSIDLSERALAWFTFNGKNTDSDASKYAANDTFMSNSPYQYGGGRWFSVPTLTRWYGASDESDAPYSTYNMDGVDSSKQTDDDIHLETAIFLPEVQNNGYQDSAVKEIQQSLIQSGAVSVGIYYDSSYLKNNDAYYYNGSTNVNHEVTIVGYDNNYSADNFNTKPEGDGAWLIKNSWGTAANKNGYFWISYYDKGFSEPTNFISEGSVYKNDYTNHTYDDIYQYDGVGQGTDLIYSNVLLKTSNTFIARKDENLAAIGTYTQAANSTVTLDIYRDATASNPESGTKIASKTVTLEYAGFHTIDLGEYEKIKKDEHITVVMTNSYTINSQKKYAISVETSTQDSLCYLDVTENVSSIFQNGTWKVTTNNTKISGANVGNSNIKLYTVDDPSATPEIEASSITYGQSLSESEITASEGTFEWVDGDIIPDAGEHNYPIRNVDTDEEQDLYINVTPKNITSDDLVFSGLDKSYVYTGKEIEPDFTIDGFKKGTDYDVYYKDNKVIGTGEVTVTFKGNYTGTKSISFKITPAIISNVNNIGNKTYTGTSQVPSITAYGNGNKLTANTDYIVSVENNKKCGKAILKVTGTGNYTGSITKYFNILPRKSSVSKIKVGKRSMKVTVKSDNAGASKQIRYSKYSNMKKAKTVSIGTSKTIKKLTKKKKYYVQVRSYVTIDGKKYYSSWSSKKKSSKIK